MYQAIEAHGWPLVSAWRTWTMSPQEADALFVRVAWLKAALPGMLAAPEGA